MKGNRFLVLIAILLFSAIPQWAQETLSLEQARAKALANSKTLRGALLSVDSALVTERIQSYEMLPSLSASAEADFAYGASTSDALTGSAGIKVTQTIYNGGKRTLLSAIDAIATSVAREEARAEYFSVLEAVDAAFYDVLEAQASVDAAQSDVEAYQTHLNLAQAKLEAGIITKYAYLQTESETAARETALIQAQGKRSTAEGKLASLVGLSPPFTVETIDFSDHEPTMRRIAGFSTDDTAAFIKAAWSTALTNNPSLAQAELAGRKARKNVDLAKADYLPSVSASASHTFPLGGSDGVGAGSGSVSLSASIPLDFWTTKANVDAEHLSVQTADLDQEEARRTLNLEIQSAVYDAISSARSVFSSQKALEYAENYYESVLELYKLSAASSSDLSDAEALVSTNRSALITARYSFLGNLSTLRTLTGLESDGLLLEMVP